MNKKKIILLVIAGVLIAALIVAVCFLLADNNDKSGNDLSLQGEQTQNSNSNIEFKDADVDMNENIVFKVGKQTVSRELFNLYVNIAGYNNASTLYSAGYIESFDNFSWDDSYSDDTIKTTYNGLAREMVLEALIPVLAVLDQGIEFGILWEDEDERNLRAWIEEQKAGFGENFNEYLEKGGYGSEQTFYDYNRLQRHRDKIYADMEGNLSKYVNLNKLSDYIKDTATANHILIMFEGVTRGTEVTEEDKAATRKRAEEVLVRLKNGEDFETLRLELSEDPGATEEGYTFNKDGELVDGNGGVLYQQFAQAAFALQVGGVSDLVETDYGFHIIKRMERKAKIADYIEYLRDNASAQVNKPVYESVKVQLNMKDYYTEEAEMPAE